MTRHPAKSLAIAASVDRSQLSKGQKTFNDLVERIGQGRARLSAWEEAISRFQEKYASQVLPAHATLADLHQRLVHCLDDVSDEKGLSKSDRQLASDIIVDLASQLLCEREDDDLKAIYNRHSEFDFDQEEAAAADGLKSMLEHVLGVELDETAGAQSPEDLLNLAHAEILERQNQFSAEKLARAEQRGRRKKSARQLALEAQQTADAQHASQSIREVYRKLASFLHPDRETDPQERTRKTALMQRVNDAYAKNNLLQLLELQLQLEHIDQAAIDNIGEDRLKHYNKVLQEQLVEINREIQRVEFEFKDRFNLPPFLAISPKMIARDLADELEGVQRAIRHVKEDLCAFGELKKVKALLARMRRERKLDAAGGSGLPF